MNTLIIAHRGESFDAPENTLSSINLAWERGAEAVEIDIQLTKDNEIVVIHDLNTKRTGKKNKNVKYQTLDELRQLDFGLWKNKKWIGEIIPTLKEVLNIVPDNKKVIIEIKSNSKILPFLNKEIINSELKNEQIEIISFNYDLLILAKEIFKNHKVLYLADLDYNWYTKLKSPSVETLVKKVKKANLNGLNVWAGKILNKDFVEYVKDAGLLLYVWTVNNPNHAKQLIEWGLDGITTDRAEWLSNKLD